MSTLPRHVRFLLAVRLTEEMYERHEEAAHYDAGFDAGEFSGPAHGRMMEREEREIALRCRVLHHKVEYELMRRANEPIDWRKVPDEALAGVPAPDWREERERFGQE